jgi:hypothetical protein
MTEQGKPISEKISETVAGAQQKVAETLEAAKAKASEVRKAARAAGEVESRPWQAASGGPCRPPARPPASASLLSAALGTLQDLPGPVAARAQPGTRPVRLPRGRRQRCCHAA